jgi:kynurenine formamidase
MTLAISMGFHVSTALADRAGTSPWKPDDEIGRLNLTTPVRTYLLAEQGAPIVELVNLEALARDKVCEFAFIGGSPKLHGADAAPLRPVVIPVRRSAGGAS